MTDAGVYVLGNIVVGFLASGSVLGGVWLKDYLDNRKVSKSTIRQKAIKAYSICGKMPYSLGSRIIACKYLLKDKSFNAEKLIKNNPDISLNLLEDLQLLIIENFYDLAADFYQVQNSIFEQLKFLTDIRCNISSNECQLSDDDFEKKTEQLNREIILVVNTLQKKLNKNYINNKCKKKAIV